MRNRTLEPPYLPYAESLSTKEKLMQIEDIPFILIIGPSGSGKTTSFRNLDRNTTEFINIEEKHLPFPKKFKHTHRPLVGAIKGQGLEDDIDPSIAITNFKKAMVESIQNPKTDLIVVDGFYQWDNLTISASRMTQRGYDIYNDHNERVKRVLLRYRACGKPMVWTGLDDTITINKGEEVDVYARRCKVYGRECAGGIEAAFTIVLWMETVKQPDKSLKYFFRTHGDGMCSAKTPLGMFKEDLIDNDLQMVLDRIWEFYEEQEEDEKPPKVAVAKKGKK
jgi:adenylate kinase family enzyme